MIAAPPAAAANSAALRAQLSDETGTGAAVFADGPTLNGTVVVKATGGSANQWVEISHDKTNGLVIAKTGDLYIEDANGTGVRVFKQGTNLNICYVGAGVNQLVIGNADNQQVIVGYWRFNSGTGNLEPLAGYQVAFSDVGIGRHSSGVLRVTDTSSGLGAIYAKLPQLADAAAGNETLYYSTDAGKAGYKDSGGTFRAFY